MSNSWYPRYHGDYMRKTAHLTLVEHGVYTVLLDHYYATGGPLPADAETLGRVCRAFTEDERAAVMSVADRFFPVNGDGMRHNQRADREMKRMAEHTKRLSEAGRKGGLASVEARLEAKVKPGLKPGKSISTSTSTSISKDTTTTPLPPKGGKSSSRFQKPSLDEVRAYVHEINAGIDPSQFLDHYEANGWHVGKTKMKDWRAAVRTWKRRKAEEGGGVAKSTLINTHHAKVPDMTMRVF